MLDSRIYTFLKLCDTMNYRKTAELLNMTQPAVTQHIQYLENIYKVKLFEYKSKTLKKTADGIKLEKHSRSVIYNEKMFIAEIRSLEKRRVSIGATKTVGDYMCEHIIDKCMTNDTVQFSFIVDNTKTLLDKLHNFELDFLMIEGYFDKSIYDSIPILNAEIVGICSEKHHFAKKEIELFEIFNEHIILREQGSGTGQVLTNFLAENNFSFSAFKKLSVVSSLNLIQDVVCKNMGISFVYSAIPEKNKNLSTFKIKGKEIYHEINYVFLKKTKADKLILELLGENAEL